jgi:3-oxoacyl-[acyl-carrier protein] reductase
MDLTGRRIIVTGASRGLGREFASALAGAGAAVVVNGTKAELVEDLVHEICQSGGRAISCIGSVADDGVAEQVVALCVQEYGGVDVVVNNAGIVRDRTLMNMTPEEFDEVVAVNLRGTWSMSRHAARAMRQSDGGLLLQVVSGSAFVGTVGQTNYAASKAGVMGMLYAWDLELKRFGIRTNALWPIAVTDMTQGMVDKAREKAESDGTPLPTPAELGLGTPATVAPIVVYLCSERASHLRSQLITFNGQRLAVWQHPRESEILRRASWTTEDLDSAMAAFAEPVYQPVF